MLYTDGLVEAKNRASELLGFNRFEQLLQECSTTPGTAPFNEKIIDRIRVFTGGSHLSDDMTLLTVLYKGMDSP